MDFLIWFIAIFAAVYGIFLLVLPKDKLIVGLKKQLEAKGNSNPTDEELSKKLKQFRIWGIVGIIASGVLIYIQLTGGIFG